MSRPLVRLQKELKESQAHPEEDIALHLYDKATRTTGGNDLFEWIAILKGPPDTPFAGGTFQLLLHVPKDYPMVPPAATFLTKVFHPNIEFHSGKVCLDILKSRWSPAWTLSSVCRAILSLLADPESSSPFNCDAGNLVRAGDRLGYEAMARYYVIEEAGGRRLRIVGDTIYL
ncbi:peroxin-4 [Angomonas deanei]|nr:peroxin-4 [Angomonas deanei]|eukprot:EPY42569.1 peroxin-4 [Angomonas deanei]